MHISYVLNFFVYAQDLFAQVSDIFVSILFRAALGKCFKAIMNQFINKQI